MALVSARTIACTVVQRMALPGVTLSPDETMLENISRMISLKLLSFVSAGMPRRQVDGLSMFISL